MDEQEEISNGTGQYSTPKEDALFFFLMGGLTILDVVLIWGLIHFEPAFWIWMKSL
jgi:hypothetical protein